MLWRDGIRMLLTRPGHAARRVGKRWYESRHPEQPWIAPATVRFLEQHLTLRSLVVEWGSGRSTAWFAGRAGRVMSIEHDPAWHRRVLAELRQKGLLDHVDYRLVALDHDPAEPTLAAYETTPAYVRAIETVGDESVDVVLVDGHYRQACVAASLAKLKPEGFLVVDNSDWLRSDLWQVPASWPKPNEGSFFGDRTTVWQKPRAALVPAGRARAGGGQ
jgi:predicted O-methyltransferase YrrM